MDESGIAAGWERAGKNLIIPAIGVSVGTPNSISSFRFMSTMLYFKNSGPAGSILRAPSQRKGLGINFCVQLARSPAGNPRFFVGDNHSQFGKRVIRR
jgi:hypothetical protein